MTHKVCFLKPFADRPIIKQATDLVVSPAHGHFSLQSCLPPSIHTKKIKPPASMLANTFAQILSAVWSACKQTCSWICHLGWILWIRGLRSRLLIHWLLIHGLHWWKILPVKKWLGRFEVRREQRRGNHSALCVLIEWLIYRPTRWRSTHCNDITALRTNLAAVGKAVVVRDAQPSGVRHVAADANTLPSCFGDVTTCSWDEYRCI